MPSVVLSIVVLKAVLKEFKLQIKEGEMKRYLSLVVAAVLIITLLTVGTSAQTGKIKEKVTLIETGSKLSPISIYDEDNLLKISIEDVGKYHGDVCLCLTISFRATQLAISQLWHDEIPKREDFKILSTHSGRGSQDAFEFITRAKTRGDFKLELQEGHLHCFRFTFIRKSTNDSLIIHVKEGIFPQEFSELRKKIKSRTATHEEEKAFDQIRQELKEKIMKLPIGRVFYFYRR